MDVIEIKKNQIMIRGNNYFKLMIIFDIVMMLIEIKILFEFFLIEDKFHFI